MIPAIMALAQLAPAVVGLFSKGETAGKAAQAVARTAQILTSTSSPDAALEALKADPDKLLRYQELMAQEAASMYSEASETVRTEMQGESWLQRNWRPITMLFFVGLVGAKWFGWSAPGITEAVELSVIGLIKIGLGGYVIGRSAEKGIKAWKK